jgi:hypothetical protein
MPRSLKGLITPDNLLHCLSFSQSQVYVDWSKRNIRISINVYLNVEFERRRDLELEENHENVAQGDPFQPSIGEERSMNKPSLC